MIELLEEAVDFLGKFLTSILDDLSKKKKIPNSRELREMILIWYFSKQFLSLVEKEYGKFFPKNGYVEDLSKLKSDLEEIFIKIRRLSPWEYFNEITIIHELIPFLSASDKETKIQLEEKFEKTLKASDRRYAHLDLLKREEIEDISKSVSIISLYFILKYRKISGLDTKKAIMLFKEKFRSGDEWRGDLKENTIDENVTKYFVYLIVREFDEDKELLKPIVDYFKKVFDSWYNEYERQLIVNYESFFAYLVLKNEDQLYPIDSVYLRFNPYRERSRLINLFSYYISLNEKAKINYNNVELRDKNGLKKFILEIFEKLVKLNIFSKDDLEILELLLRNPNTYYKKRKLSSQLKYFFIHTFLLYRYRKYGVLIHWSSERKRYEPYISPWEMDPKTFFYYHLSLGLIAFLLLVDTEFLTRIEKVISENLKFKYVEERRGIGAFYPYELYNEKVRELVEFLMPKPNNKLRNKLHNNQSKLKFSELNIQFPHLRTVESKPIEIYPIFKMKWNKNWDLRLVVTIRDEKIKGMLRKINEDLTSIRNHVLQSIARSEDSFEIIRAKDNKSALNKLTSFLDELEENKDDIVIIRGDIKKFSMSADRKAIINVIKKSFNVDADKIEHIERIFKNLVFMKYYENLQPTKGIPEGIAINPILLELVFIVLLYQAYKSVKKNIDGFIRIIVYNEDFIIISNNNTLLKDYYKNLQNYLDYVGWKISKEKAIIASLNHKKNKELINELNISYKNEFSYLGAKIKIENDSPPYTISFDDKRLKRVKWSLASRFVNRLINLDMLTNRLELEIYSKKGIIDELYRDRERTFYDGSEQLKDIEQWLSNIAGEALKFIDFNHNVDSNKDKEIWNQFEIQLAKKLRSFVRNDVKIYVVTDAAFFKQDRLAGYGILIESLDDQEKICYKIVDENIKSSQLAEATAILIGIKRAKEKFGEKPTLLISDNKFVINAINKRSRIRDPEVQKVIEKIRTYKYIEFIYKPESTEKIRIVDIISKKALEELKNKKIRSKQVYKVECPQLKFNSRDS